MALTTTEQKELDRLLALRDTPAAPARHGDPVDEVVWVVTKTGRKIRLVGARALRFLVAEGFADKDDPDVVRILGRGHQAEEFDLLDDEDVPADPGHSGHHH